LLDDPFCDALGGSVKSVTVTIVSVALLPMPMPGTPVTDQISSSSSERGGPGGFGSVPKAESIQSVEVDDRLFAGMIGKPVSSCPLGSAG
jgi:hypothetical protein